MNLQVVEQSDAVTHVALRGCLDVEGVNAIQDQFYFNLTARRKPSIVDMAGVTFIGSLGVGMLVRVAQSLRRNGVRMVLLNPKGTVEETLRILDLGQVIPMTANHEEALGLLG
ncbi:MAG: STAS domain-containing protein [Planctomycetota bacterium]